MGAGVYPFPFLPGVVNPTQVTHATIVISHLPSQGDLSLSPLLITRQNVRNVHHSVPLHYNDHYQSRPLPPSWGAWPPGSRLADPAPEEGPLPEDDLGTPMSSR